MTVNIDGNPAQAGSVQCFSGHDNLLVAHTVFRLAEKLGLDIEKRDDGIQWIRFLREGKPLTNVAFYQPSHAYAFLLGVAAGSQKDVV